MCSCSQDLTSICSFWVGHHAHSCCCLNVTESAESVRPHRRPPGGLSIGPDYNVRGVWAHGCAHYRKNAVKEIQRQAAERPAASDALAGCVSLDVTAEGTPHLAPSRPRPDSPFQEWMACLGHASIAAAVRAAERSLSAWKALAEEALVKGRAAVRAEGRSEGRDGGAGSMDGGPSSCEAAARGLAECCEVTWTSLLQQETHRRYAPAVCVKTALATFRCAASLYTFGVFCFAYRAISILACLLPILYFTPPYDMYVLPDRAVTNICASTCACMLPSRETPTLLFLPVPRQEEAFVKFMLARDVWPSENEVGSDKDFLPTTTARGPATVARTPAGLEAGGPRRLAESSLALLQRAKRLRETGGLSSPRSSSPSPPGGDHRQRRLSGSPVPMSRSPKALLSDSSPGGGRGVGGGGSRKVGREEMQAARKRAKLSDAFSTSGPGDSARVRGGEEGGGQEEAKEKDRMVWGAGGGRDGAEDDDNDDEDDVRRWQVLFVMGRLCAQLGRDPWTVLKTLAEALRLAQVA